MNDILALLDSLGSKSQSPNGKTPIAGFGFISCASRVHIRHVPFYTPCIILVLSGRKLIGKMACEAGDVLTVPAPASYDLRNEPEARSGRYRALIIPFEHDDLERLRAAHAIETIRQPTSIGPLRYDGDAVLIDAVKHYLSSHDNARLLKHRLLEILLILATKDRRLLAYPLAQENWAQRVRACLATDLAYAWSIGEVCKRLATSESALRRNLQRETTGFRELLQDLRLSTALTQLLQTSLPIYRVAYDCGYQSVSRFTSNFHKRFGLPPSALRLGVDENEQNLAVREHSSVA